MNYRHAYHAGNFADVLKHLVLALVIEHLKQKDSPFRVIDTHAGVGLYDLSGTEAQKTGEWHNGIGRILSHPWPGDVAPLLAPYLEAVRAVNPDGDLRYYPGSPSIARYLLRDSDVLIANELHKEDHAALSALFARDPQAKILSLDGWTALKSLLPPKERRGLVLVDPPFEQADELERLISGLKDALKRFATGVYILWFPIKSVRPIDRFYAGISALGPLKLALIELYIRAPNDPERLNGTGLLIVNPPYLLPEQMRALLPALVPSLADGDGAFSVVSLSCPPQRV